MYYLKMPGFEELCAAVGLSKSDFATYVNHRFQYLTSIIRLDLTRNPLASERNRPPSEPRLGFHEWFYKLIDNFGPKQQSAFLYRFPLSAQDYCGPNGSFSFTNLFKWAGKIREISGINTSGAYPEIMKAIGSNEIVSATNSFETHIYTTEEPSDADMVEVRFWAEEVREKTADLYFEWWLIGFPPDSRNARLMAWSRMQISSIQVLQHGKAIAVPWPQFFYDFLKVMAPKNDNPSIDHPRTDISQGNLLFKMPEGPTVGPKVFETTFQTTFEDSNLVRNIYFANYGVWQARARDLFLLKVAGSVEKALDLNIKCEYVNVKQLNEAMPFDKVRVTVHLSALFETGVVLLFEYLLDHANSVKLASGTQKISFGENSDIPDRIKKLIEMQS